MRPDNIAHRGHLDEIEIAAFIDGAMTDTERRAAELHLASCDECRVEAIASQEAVSSAPSAIVARPRYSLRWVGAAAAAAVMIVALSTFNRTTTQTSTERSSPPRLPDTQRTVAILSPPDGTALGDDRRLTWRSDPDGATYRVTIGDDSGQPVHSATLPDTSFVIPQSVTLTTGRKYFWYVDAITAAGTTATSGLNSFTVD